MESVIKLPDCHPDSEFIINRLGRKIISEYCLRLSKVKKVFFNYYKLFVCLRYYYVMFFFVFFIDYKLNPSIPSAVRVWRP